MVGSSGFRQRAELPKPSLNWRHPGKRGHTAGRNCCRTAGTFFSPFGAASPTSGAFGSLDGKVKRLLIRSDSNAQYVLAGYVLFLSVLAQSFDPAHLALDGQPMPIAARVGRSSRGDGAFSSSSKGTLAYAGASLRTGRLTWFDRSGTPRGEVGPDGDHDYADFRLSPDDTRLAASLVDPKVALPDIWLVDLVRGNSWKFTLGPALNAAAVWSPDGGRIAFRSTRKGLAELYLKSAGGGGTDQPLLVEDAVRATGVGTSNLLTSDWSSDGQHIAFSAGIPVDLWLLPADGARARPGSPAPHRTSCTPTSPLTAASSRTRRTSPDVMRFMPRRCRNPI
jgi:WD40-like Beta Propeller Repeat